MAETTEARERVWSRWKRRSIASRVLPLLIVAALLVQGAAVALGEQKQGASEDVVVVFPHSVEATAVGVINKVNIQPTYRYTKAVDGFAATVTPEVRQELEQIPGAIVSPNRRVEAFDDVKANGDQQQGKAKGGHKDAQSEGKH